MAERCCWHCGKFVIGLKDHIRDKHPESGEGQETWEMGPDFKWYPPSMLVGTAFQQENKT